MKRGQQDENHHGRTSEKIILGRITGVYGVNGWLKIFSYADPMESIVDYSPWYIRPESRSGSRNTAPWEKVKLEAGKRHAKTVIAKLEHCNDRDEAQAYVGSEIAIEPAQLEQLKGKDEFYWHELTGLRVINQQGIELGVVKSLMETGANDVLVVAEESTDTEASERLIPWIMHQSVIAVDLQQGILEVDWDPDF
ncbi:MAG: ribosome maturation factor RimM [Gammaproteobacteria bacterium]|nr:ribosome maturation factor RimM [Gammaproteobacteria bacterium]